MNESLRMADAVNGSIPPAAQLIDRCHRSGLSFPGWKIFPMKTFLQCALGLALAGFVSSAGAQTSASLRQDRVVFPARIDGRDFQLEAMIYRPDDAARHPLAVFSHGRNGMFPARNTNEVNGYATICRALAAEGIAVAFIVRRGYGNSEGPDSELQDTAVQSGLEAAKDYKGAVTYWRTADFAQPDRVVLMGQSQGGWAVLACTNVAMEGVLGVVNISGGTNYRLMGTGAVTAAVQDHWVEGCSVLGTGALVPSFWVYSENDQSISGPTARRMFNAYANAGGWAWLDMLPAYGSNGHAIVERPDLFLPQLNDYLATVGFLDAADSTPVISSISGPSSVVAGGTAVFTASVTGNPVPTLQWRKDGVDLRNGGGVSGVTSSALTVANAQSADTGTYTVVAVNPQGTATSNGISLALSVPASTPPSTPAPSPAPPGGGGGGGAVSTWFLVALALLGATRLAGRNRRKSSVSPGRP